VCTARGITISSLLVTTGAIEMAEMPTTTTGPDTAKRANTTKLVTVGVIIAAAIWFILANTGKARVRLWIPNVSAPMWLVLLITFAGGMIAGLLIRRRAKRAAQ
jgi:uncharacterized integral membrane protein